MANGYISSVAYAAVTQWAALTTYTVGQYRRQLATPAYGNDRVFKVTSITTGISGAAEPSWNLGNNATTTDAGVTWTQVGGQESQQSAGNWTAPLGTLQAAINVNVFSPLFISSDHTETNSSSFTFTGNGLVLASVSRTGATLPPTDADLVAGATINTTGASSITFGGILECIGVTFKAGSGSSAASINLDGNSGGVTDNDLRFINCSMVLNNTSASSLVSTGNPSGATTSQVYMKNTPVTFGAVGQSVQINVSNSFNMVFEWCDTPSAVQGSVPTSLFTGFYGTAILHGLDLSSCSGNLYASSATMRYQAIMFSCQLHASVSFPTNFTVDTLNSWFRLANCDSSAGGTNYRIVNCNLNCQITTSGEIARTGGASDGTTLFSHKHLPVNTGSLTRPNVGAWMNEYYAVTGSPVTLTINVISFTTAIPNNSTLWMETETLDTSGAPLGAGHTTGNLLAATTGTNLTATTEAWDAGTVAARQNSHAYALGDLIKVAANPGRVFYCTAAGTSAGSEPGGYATAVDGGAVTDSGATFRAGWRVKLTQTFTPQMKGFVKARVMGALGTSNTFYYVDPKLIIA